MSKLYSSYSNTFQASIASLGALYDEALSYDSLNGLYIAHKGSVDLSGVASTTAQKVATWYDLSGSTNYMYSSYGTAPVFVASDSQFNGNSCIDFGPTGTNKLRFKYAYEVKTIILVYVLSGHMSYLIYSPAYTPPPDSIFYDMFPSFTDKLWSRCSLSEDFAYSSDSRINSRPVSSQTYLPLQFTRILSTTNFKGTGKSGSISGIGGRQGQPNGGSNASGDIDGVKGKISAVLTFSEVLTSSQMESLELKLKDLYINYNGPALSTTVALKYLYGSQISYDFLPATVDEWSAPSTYEVLYPLSPSLTFSGSVLTGAASEVYEGVLKIRITNQLGLSTVHDVSLEIVRPDPLIPFLPAVSDISLVLSSHINSDQARYGVYTDITGKVTKWEDARRIGNIPTLTAGSAKAEYVTSPSMYVRLRTETYSNPSIIRGKTFLWIYKQKEYGNRLLLNSFADRRGNGALWTTANTSELFGQTAITQLEAKVNKVAVNELTYRLKLDKLSFITAVQPDNQTIDITGISSMRGELYFLCVWDKVLTPAQLDSAIDILADRYISYQGPFIANSDTEYVYDSEVAIDLTSKVVDLHNRPLSYTILQNNRNATITNGVLSFTAITDELLIFSIEVSNGTGLTSVLTFTVDITLRTNSLYVAIKSYLSSLVSTPNLTSIYLAESDTVTSTSQGVMVQWSDYRLNGTYGTAINTSLSSHFALGDRQGVEFLSNGSSYINLSSNSTITSRDWIIVYVKPVDATGNVFLLGNNTSALFGGTNDALFTPSLSSADVQFGDIYLNKLKVIPAAKAPIGILNVIYVHTVTALTVDSFAKDRVFDNSSIKGLVPCILSLDKQLSLQEYVVLDSIIRDYFDPVRFILLLHLNNNAIDSSTASALVTGTANFSNVSKFGSHSLLLGSNTLSISSTDFAYINESFTISFWLLISAPLGLTGNYKQYIWRQDGLVIYLKTDGLYVSLDQSSPDFLLKYVLPTSFYSPSIIRSGFNHIEINTISQDGIRAIELYINGQRQGVNDIQYSYLDTTSPQLIGGSTGSNSTGSVILVDEFAVVRRGYLHSDNFTAPTSEYVV